MGRSRLAIGVLVTALVASMPLGAIAQDAVPAPAASAPTIGRAFNADDYDLAWRAFLSTGHLDDAIALAQKAVAAQPGSALWHQRLAAAAEQNSNAALAAREYAWLAEHGNQLQSLGHAIDLAVGTQQDALAVQLLTLRAEREPFSESNWNAVVGALLNSARFDDALAVLARADRAQPRRYFLRQQAYVQHVQGHPDAEAAVLARSIARYGPSAQDNLQLATIQYVADQPRQALATLNQAQPGGAPSDTEYWQTLSSLAWLLQDRAATEQAAKVLMQTGQATVPDYRRLYLLNLQRDPAVAYAYAFVGWQRTRASTLFFAALSAADLLGQPVLGEVVFASVQPKDRPELQAEPDFWVQWAQLAAWQGNTALAQSRYAQALTRAPGDASALAGYLWLLIDDGDVPQLRLLVDRLTAPLPASPALRSALASALSLLERPSQALALLAPPPIGAVDGNLQIADLLDQADQPDTAAAYRLRAAIALAYGAKVDPAQRDPLLLSLRNRLTPGDPVRMALAQLGPRAGSVPLRSQALAWAVGQNSSEAVALWLRRYFRNASADASTADARSPTPGAVAPADALAAVGEGADVTGNAFDQPTPAPFWATLSQSLATDDDAATARLLATEADRLPRRDRVTAASKLGWRSQALTLAYEGLQGEPNDRDLATQFQDLAIPASSAAGGELGWLRTSGLQTQQATADAQIHVAPAWMVDVQAHQRHQSTFDAKQIGQVPASARDGIVELTQQRARGERGVRVGGGRNVAGFGQLGAFYRWRLSSTLNAALAVDVGQRVDDTAPLSVAGLSDRVTASASQQWTARDSVSASLNMGRLRAQGGGRLGNKQSFSLEARHALWLAPPSIALVGSVTEARYQRADTLPAALRPLVPTGAAADTAFFVPRSFTQACAGVGVNAGVSDTWTDRWHAFVNASACQNSVAGWGATVTGGFATPVLGPDHLSLELGYANNAGAIANRTLSATLGYRYYFSP